MTTCPSCRYKLSPLAVECPVCGIPLSRPPQKRPLLFQISRGLPPLLQSQGSSKQKGIVSPAFGRVQNIEVRGSAPPPLESPRPKEDGWGQGSESPFVPAETGHGGVQSIFWRLAMMEFQEAASIVAINLIVSAVACWQLGIGPALAYKHFWHFLSPVHFVVSWAWLMLPIVLTGSSVAMLRFGLGIADAQSEKRISFSIFLLLSVVLLPLSFLCMVLTPAHMTLAEILTGQEVRERGSR